MQRCSCCLQKKCSKIKDKSSPMEYKIRLVPVDSNSICITKEEHREEHNGEEPCSHCHKHYPSLQQWQRNLGRSNQNPDYCSKQLSKDACYKISWLLSGITLQQHICKDALLVSVQSSHGFMY